MIPSQCHASLHLCSSALTLFFTRIPIRYFVRFRTRMILGFNFFPYPSLSVIRFSFRFVSLLWEYLQLRNSL